MTAITLPQGAVLLIDSADEQLLDGARVRLQSEGYAKLGRHYVHRLVARARPGQIVDHINGNRLDCRRSNLRTCSQSENGRNRGKAKHNKSGFKGVYVCCSTGRFRAEIRVNGRGIKLGRFATAEAAARAYDSAAREHHGAFARTNFDQPEVPK